MSEFKLLQVCSYMGTKVWIARREDHGVISLDSSMHLYNPSQDSMELAISDSQRLGIDNIVCYELSDSEFLNRQHYYVTRL